MGLSQLEGKKAVDSGYWLLYRYDPRLKEAKKSPLVLDSKEPTGDFQEFLMGEVHYSSLTRMFPENAKNLFAIAEKDVKERYAFYKKMAAEQLGPNFAHNLLRN